MAALWSVRRAQAADFIQSVHASHSEQVLLSRRATVLSWLGWCRERGYDGPAVPAWTKRLAVPNSETPARSRMTIDDVLELGAGHGRDPLFFAHKGFTVQATDFSPAGLEQLRNVARSQGVEERMTTAVHNVREPLALPDASVDAVFAHMLLCMALSTAEIHALVGEVHRILRPDGAFVYTVRQAGDDFYEHGGFAVHFFGRDLVDALADGWTLEEIHALEEGDLPRRLCRVTQTLPL